MGNNWDEMIVVGKCRKCGVKLWAYPWETPEDPVDMECIHCATGLVRKSASVAPPGKSDNELAQQTES